MLRKPIITFLGHIDHGKTSLIDKIRGTAVQLKEAGGITQHIGATEIPLEVILRVTKPLLDKFRFQLKIPGILIIDTPGHEAFMTMRRIGGTLADLAVLVIDINEGVMPQTKECIELLKQAGTPFVVAANKLDLVPGWRSYPGEPFMLSYQKQRPEAKKEFEERLYMLVGDLSYFDISADLYTNISDFRSTVPIVPTSAKTGEGIADLLLIIAGLAQKYLEDRLKLNVQGPAKGSIIEVKEVLGAGTTLDVIIYDGVLRVGDKVAFLTKQGPRITVVKGIYLPKPLKETRGSIADFVPVEEVAAAAGVKLVVREPEGALTGSPLLVVENEQEVLECLQRELSSVIFQSERTGVIVKADTFGTLQALLYELTKAGIPVRKADIGIISKEDVLLAELVKAENKKYGVVLGFNVDITDEALDYALEKGIKIIIDNVIYKLVEQFQEYVKQLEQQEIEELFSKIVLPCKFKLLPEFIFRKSKPAIVGIKILAGTLRPGVTIIREDGKEIGTLKEIQEKGETVKKAIVGKEVAVSIEGGVVGRNLKEDYLYYTKLGYNDMKLLKEKLWDYLRSDEKELWEEYKKKFFKGYFF
ncbi:MAG: translation initiation factor IF-2 [bacterium]|nr:translation initiation factor IF-2 [bacterium]